MELAVLPKVPRGVHPGQVTNVTWQERTLLVGGTPESYMQSPKPH